ncbi:hypothetical protein LTR53_020406, partial [Teratosphaeriaceae sp. CCFEE 6253]
MTQKDIETLFDERDVLLTLFTQGQQRIDKLESLVQELSMQIASRSTLPAAGPSPASTQKLSLQTTNGQSIGISVPKGSGFNGNGIKENRAP